MILRNKDLGQGRGSKREFVLEEASSVKDKMKTGAKVPFMNRKESLGLV